MHESPKKTFSTQKRISFSEVHFICQRPVIRLLSAGSTDQTQECCSVLQCVAVCCSHQTTFLGIHSSKHHVKNTRRGKASEGKEECEGCHRRRLPVNPCSVPQIPLPRGSYQSAPGLWTKMSIPARAEAGHSHRHEWAKEKEACHPTCPCRG